MVPPNTYLERRSNVRSGNRCRRQTPRNSLLRRAGCSTKDVWTVIGSDAELDSVRKAEKSLYRAQTKLLESGGWKAVKSDYDLITRWHHPDVGLISRATAVELATGRELEWN